MKIKDPASTPTNADDVGAALHLLRDENVASAPKAPRQGPGVAEEKMTYVMISKIWPIIVPTG